MLNMFSDLHNNVDTRLDSGWTPLLHACYYAQENVVNFLLNKGADPNLQAGQQVSLYSTLNIMMQNYA